MNLILISNRLPSSIKRSQKGKITAGFTPGGLAVGLSSYLKKQQTANSKTTWLGWPGAESLSPAEQKKISAELHRQNMRPIFLSLEQIKNFYLGFCNNTLWPLFHYFPSLATFQPEHWRAYKETNEQYFKEAKKLDSAGSVFWVHDFQLMLLPRLLREGLSESRQIGFFLHIPFPSFEIFRLLPKKWREEILLGLLGADLIGFHTYDYALYFISCVRRILGFETSMDAVILPSGRRVKVEVFPMGIDFEKYNQANKNPEVQSAVTKIRQHAKVEKIIFSADRLDYTKGLLNRLNGFELFLEIYPQWQGKTQLVMVVAPNRGGLLSLEEMKKQIDETVGKINGRFGSLNWTPVIYHYRVFEFEEMLAHYLTADVALVTPLRDGMNLVSKEYIASRQDFTGNLILSEMAGAAQELGEALTVNPRHLPEIAEAINEALTTPIEEQKEKIRLMQSRIKNYGLLRWAEDFLASLKSSFTEGQKQKQEADKTLTTLEKDKIIKKFKKSKRKILLLDYDGTLSPYFKYPFLARPSESLLKLLSRLAENPSTHVVIISGRDKTTLENWFYIPHISLIAEHGIFLKDRSNGSWVKTSEAGSDWKNTVLPIMRNFVTRLPGSFVEEKEYSLAWHYRLANPEVAAVRSKELIDNLKSLSVNSDWQIYSGHKIVEVKSQQAQKGLVALRLLEEEKYDFILAAGDDATDEDLFKSLPARSYTVKIGRGRSEAEHRLLSSQELLNLLQKLA